MKTYRITERSFIGVSLYGPDEAAGDTVTVADDVQPGKTWVALDGEKPAKAKRGKVAEAEAGEPAAEVEAEALA